MLQPGLLGVIEDAMRTGGYPALGGLIVAENLFPPIPSEVVLPLAGYYVSEGTLQFGLALVVATSASVLGALILYAIGRYGGRPMLLRHGRLLRITPKHLDRADDWFDAHGPKIVLFGRLAPGIRSLVSIPAGASEMSLGLFVLLTAIGSGLWNAALISAGVALGNNWDQVGGYLGPASAIVLGAATATLVVFLMRARR
jgi:membrane protein DedA with SNARE-associated domain